MQGGIYQPEKEKRRVFKPSTWLMHSGGANLINEASKTAHETAQQSAPIPFQRVEDSDKRTRHNEKQGNGGYV